MLQASGSNIIRDALGCRLPASTAMFGAHRSELCYDWRAWASWHVYNRENVCSASCCRCVQPWELCCCFQRPLLCALWLCASLSRGRNVVLFRACTPMVVWEAEASLASFLPSQLGNEPHSLGALCCCKWQHTWWQRRHKLSLLCGR